LTRGCEAIAINYLNFEPGIGKDKIFMDAINEISSIYPSFDYSTDSSESLYLLRLDDIYGDGLLEEYLEGVGSDTAVTGEIEVDTVNSAFRETLVKDPSPVLV
jgi:hypothetical protein